MKYLLLLLIQLNLFSTSSYGACTTWAQANPFAASSAAATTTLSLAAWIATGVQLHPYRVKSNEARETYHSLETSIQESNQSYTWALSNASASEEKAQCFACALNKMPSFAAGVNAFQEAEQEGSDDATIVATCYHTYVHPDDIRTYATDSITQTYYWKEEECSSSSYSIEHCTGTIRGGRCCEDVTHSCNYEEYNEVALFDVTPLDGSGMELSLGCNSFCDLSFWLSSSENYNLTDPATSSTGTPSDNCPEDVTNRNLYQYGSRLNYTLTSREEVIESGTISVDGSLSASQVAQKVRSTLRPVLDKLADLTNSPENSQEGLEAERQQTEEEIASYYYQAQKILNQTEQLTLELEEVNNTASRSNYIFWDKFWDPYGSVSIAVPLAGGLFTLFVSIHERLGSPRFSNWVRARDENLRQCFRRNDNQRRR